MSFSDSAKSFGKCMTDDILKSKHCDGLILIGPLMEKREDNVRFFIFYGKGENFSPLGISIEGDDDRAAEFRFSLIATLRQRRIAHRQFHDAFEMVRFSAERWPDSEAAITEAGAEVRLGLVTVN